MDHFEHKKFLQTLKEKHHDKFKCDAISLLYVDRKGDFISKELWDHLSELPEYYIVAKETLFPFTVYTVWLGEVQAPFRTLCVNHLQCKKIGSSMTYDIIYREDAQCEKQALKVHNKVAFYTDQKFFNK